MLYFYIFTMSTQHFDRIFLQKRIINVHTKRRPRYSSRTASIEISA